MRVPAFQRACRPASAADKVDFQREIRPILAYKCFACHGRDAEHREGGLRLDEREAALNGDQDTRETVDAAHAQELAAHKVDAACRLLRARLTTKAGN